MKNLIFAILISLTAIFNLTSCDRLNIDKSESYLEADNENGAYFTNKVMKASYDNEAAADSLNEVAAACVQNYLQDNLGDLADNIFVSPDFKTVSFTAKSCRSEEVEIKLMEMSNNKSALSAQIRREIPQAKNIELTICHNCRNTNFFHLHYTK